MEKKQRKRTVKPLRKIYRSYPEEVKIKVVREIQSGFHSHRAAAKLYGISQNTVNNWVVQYSLLNLDSLNSKREFMGKSSESSTIRHLNRQVVELQKALVNSQLKIESLETMIKVSEEELKKVKIANLLSPIFRKSVSLLLFKKYRLYSSFLSGNIFFLFSIL